MAPGKGMRILIILKVFLTVLLIVMYNYRTLTARLLQEYPHMFGLSVSHTTRHPRVGEENGVHYHFVSKEEMDTMIEEGKFIEFVSLFGYMYGTSVNSIDKVTEEGKVCIMDLEIEVIIRKKKYIISDINFRQIYQ